MTFCQTFPKLRKLGSIKRSETDNSAYTSPINENGLENLVENLDLITDHSLLQPYNAQIPADKYFNNLPRERLICAGYIYGNIDACQGKTNTSTRQNMRLFPLRLNWHISAFEKRFHETERS